MSQFVSRQPKRIQQQLLETSPQTTIQLRSAMPCAAKIKAPAHLSLTAPTPTRTVPKTMFADLSQAMFADLSQAMFANLPNDPVGHHY
jgi:hypothetical protein